MIKFIVAAIILATSVGINCDANCRNILIKEALVGVLAGTFLALITVMDRTLIAGDTSIADIKDDLLHEIRNAFVGGFLVGLTFAIVLYFLH